MTLNPAIVGFLLLSFYKVSPLSFIFTLIVLQGFDLRTGSLLNLITGFFIIPHIAPAMENQMENEMALGLYEDNFLEYIANSLNS